MLYSKLIICRHLEGINLGMDGFSALMDKIIAENKKLKKDIKNTETQNTDLHKEITVLKEKNKKLKKEKIALQEKNTNIINNQKTKMKQVLNKFLDVYCDADAVNNFVYVMYYKLFMIYKLSNIYRDSEM